MKSGKDHLVSHTRQFEAEHKRQAFDLRELAHHPNEDQIQLSFDFSEDLAEEEALRKSGQSSSDSEEAA